MRDGCLLLTTPAELLYKGLSDAEARHVYHFFALLQKNVLNRRAWATREELRIAMVTWIERTYPPTPTSRALGRLTPIEYELIMTTNATQAA